MLLMRQWVLKRKSVYKRKLIDTESLKIKNENRIIWGKIIKRKIISHINIIKSQFKYKHY